MDARYCGWMGTKYFKEVAALWVCLFTLFSCAPIRAEEGQQGTALMEDPKILEFSQLCLKVAIQARPQRTPEFQTEKEAVDAFKKLQLMGQTLEELLRSNKDEVSAEFKEVLKLRLSECRGALKQNGLEL